MNGEESRELQAAHGRLNEAFGRLAEVAEGYAERDVIDVLELAREAGLEIEESALAELKIDRFVYPIRWLPWWHWYPWRPLYCWWWHRYYPYYRCCPWWWYRCHWYPWPLT